MENRLSRRQFLKATAGMTFAAGAASILEKYTYAKAVESSEKVDQEANTLQNLVKNPSFEIGSNKEGIPDDWQPLDLISDWRTVEYSHDDEVAHTGKYSVKISKGNVYLKITGLGSWAQKGVVENGAGRTFTLSTYIKASELTRVQLYLFGNDPDWGDDFDGAASQVFEVDTNWQKISHTNTFGPSIAAVHIVFVRIVQIGGGDVWFDDVELVELAK